MRKFRWMVSLLWLLFAFVAFSVLVSLPIVRGLFTGILDAMRARSGLAGLAQFLDETGVPFMRLLFVLLIALMLLNHFIGLRWGFGRELKDSWRWVPKGLKQIFFVTTLLVGVVHLDWAMEQVIGLFSVEFAAKYDEQVSQHIQVALFGLPLIVLTACYIVLFTALVLLGNSRRPAWERAGFQDGNRSPRDTSAQRVVLSRAQSRKLRKAEMALEAGRVGKAARLFERVGDQYAYRAGKLYERLGNLDRAARTFVIAGRYFAKHRSCKRAGDAFFAARQWAESVKQYRNAIDEEQLSGHQLEALVRNMGEAYYHQEMFLEAGQLYRDYGFQRKAGECFERAGKSTEAAEAYAKAGDSEASAKIFEQSGRLDLAGLERGRAYMVRGDFLKAAEEFNAVGRHADAADAYKRAGELRKAAESFQKEGGFQRAAELFIEAGATEDALQCYLRIEDYGAAAQLASHLGLQDKQALYYDRAGNHLAAARSYLMIQDLDNAVRCFTTLAPESADQVYACTQVLQILIKQSRVKEALACGEAILAGTRPTPTTAPLFFVYANIKERLGSTAHAADLYVQASALLPTNKTYAQKARQMAVAAGIPYETIMAETIVEDRASGPQVQQPHRDDIDSMDVSHHTQPGAPDHSEVVDNTHTIDELDESMVFDLAEQGDLSRYEMIQELGRGGMGIVYKARDRKLDRLVAFKMLHPEYNKDPKVLLFFKREARAIAQLNHPNIVTLYDVGSERDCFFMVMEFVEGMTLERLRSKYPKYVNQNFLGLLYETCTGLKVAHDKGVLHRDLKPANLMVTKDGRVKIMDFGLAKKVSDPAKTQQVWGTPVFMAPEVMQGAKATFASDIYSVGVTYYLLLTGEVPFDKETMSNKFVGDGLPRAPNEIVSEISLEVSETLLRCMHRDPKERYQNAGELLTVVKLLGQRTKTS